MITNYILSSGVTVAAFPYAHNWASAVIERIAYLTDIQRGFSGREQRVNLRRYPRRTLEYRHQAQEKSRIFIETMFAAYHSRKFAVPVWMDAQIVDVGETDVTDEIALDTAYLDFAPGSPAMIYRNEHLFEIAEVAAVESDKVIFVNDLQFAWRGVLKIVPCRVAALDAKTSIVKATNEIIETRIVWRLLPGQATLNRLAAPELAEYLNHPVYRPAHNWSGEQEITQSIGRETLDYETGTWLDDPLETTAVASVPVAQVFDSRRQIAEFLGFLEDRRGSQKAFWLYLPTVDLYVDISTAPQAYQHIQRTGYGDFLFNLPNRRHLAIKYSDDGSVSFHHVDNIRSVTATNESLTLTPFIGHNFPSLNTAEYLTRRISFLRYCRFEANETEIAWQTSNIAQVTTRFQELTTVPTGLESDETGDI